MKIVDLRAFLALPAETVFSKYEPCSFENICIKGESMTNDFAYQQIHDAVDSGDTGEFVDILESATETGESFEMDFDCQSRDAMFDKDQLFAVWERQDVYYLIKRLQKTLKLSSEEEESKDNLDEFFQKLDLHQGAMEESEYRVSFELADGVRLKQMMLSHAEHRWKFEYLCQFPGEKKRTVRYQNKITLWADYSHGKLEEIRVMCEISHPELARENRRLKIETDNERMNFSATYKQNGNIFELTEVDCGARLLWKKGDTEEIGLQEKEGSLIKSLPFQILEVLELEYGKYRFPYPKNETESGYFVLPANLTS